MAHEIGEERCARGRPDRRPILLRLWRTPTFEEENRLEDMGEDEKLLKTLILDAASGLGHGVV